MTSHKIEPFDPGQETFSRYVQRVKIYFTAHGVADDKQKFVFLSSLSRKHYTLLANLVSPEDPGAKTLDELVDTLTLHFQPKTSEIADRYAFLCRHQEPEEDIAEFVANLKRLIVPCNYSVEFQKTILRDRFVCGLANESTRKRLLTEENKLTFEEAIAIAVAVEKATTQARLMKADSKPVVHQVHQASRSSEEVKNSPLPATDVEEHILQLPADSSVKNVVPVEKRVTLPKFVGVSRNKCSRVTPASRVIPCQITRPCR